jgi:hypothetical protein
LLGAVATPDGLRVYVVVPGAPVQVVAYEAAGTVAWTQPVGLDLDIGGEIGGERVPITCDDERVYLARHHSMC